MTHIAVGSNIQPHVHVPRAMERLADLFGELTISPFYETPAIDRPEQPPYWNGVVRIETTLPEGVLRERLREVEEAEGRVRTSDKWASRTLDLDILEMDGAWEHELFSRPFLAKAVADIGDLPEGVDAPTQSWPIAWQA